MTTRLTIKGVTTPLAATLLVLAVIAAACGRGSGSLVDADDEIHGGSAGQAANATLQPG